MAVRTSDIVTSSEPTVANTLGSVVALELTVDVSTFGVALPSFAQPATARTREITAADIHLFASPTAILKACSRIVLPRFLASPSVPADWLGLECSLFIGPKEARPKPYDVFDLEHFPDLLTQS